MNILQQYNVSAISFNATNLNLPTLVQLKKLNVEKIHDDFKIIIQISEAGVQNFEESYTY